MKIDREPTKEEVENVSKIMDQLNEVFDGQSMEDVFLALTNFICVISLENNISKTALQKTISETYDFMLNSD